MLYKTNNDRLCASEQLPWVFHTADYTFSVFFRKLFPRLVIIKQTVGHRVNQYYLKNSQYCCIHKCTLQNIMEMWEIPYEKNRQGEIWDKKRVWGCWYLLCILRKPFRIKISFLFGSLTFEEQSKQSKWLFTEHALTIFTKTLLKDQRTNASSALFSSSLGNSKQTSQSVHHRTSLI